MPVIPRFGRLPQENWNKFEANLGNIANTLPSLRYIKT